MVSSTDTLPIPTDIAVFQKSKQVQLTYEDGEVMCVSVSKLRAHSPSAENVKLNDTASNGKDAQKQNDVNIQRVDPVGHYGLRIHFSDGHTSGIYTWALLKELAELEMNS